MLRKICNKAINHQLPLRTLDVKYLWGYVAIAFNKVDAERLKLVGPDRLCAEWLLKNSGAIRLKELPTLLLRDYNSLPPESTRFRIIEADASNSSIMKIGLDHFKGCQHIEKVIFHQCKHLEDDGLDGLKHLKDTLKELQISGCYNLNDKSFSILTELKHLQKLKMFDLRYVKNFDDIKKKLTEKLPQCLIDIQPK